MLYSGWCSAAAPRRPVSMAVIRTFDFSSAMYIGLDAIANRKIYETYMHSDQIAYTGMIPLPAATIKWHMILHRIDLFIKTIDLLFAFGIYTSENTSNSHLNHR